MAPSCEDPCVKVQLLEQEVTNLQKEVDQMRDDSRNLRNILLGAFAASSLSFLASLILLLIGRH